MLLLELFWSFVKIGFTSFGGLSMIPLITSEMLAHGWMTAEEVSDIVGIAEMTPGPVGLNCATFAGMRTAGIIGAFAANLGALVPSLTFCALAAMFFERFKNNRRMTQVLVGVRPASLGMIAGMMVTMTMQNYVRVDTVSWVCVGIGLLDALLLMKWKVSIPAVIGISAVLGLLFFGVLGL